jgi:hypothetical protein
VTGLGAAGPIMGLALGTETGPLGPAKGSPIEASEPRRDDVRGRREALSMFRERFSPPRGDLSADRETSNGAKIARLCHGGPCSASSRGTTRFCRTIKSSRRLK